MKYITREWTGYTGRVWWVNERVFMGLRLGWLGGVYETRQAALAALPGNDMRRAVVQ